MEMRRPIIELMNFINKAHKETTDTLIAKAIIEHRFELDSLSLEQLGERCFVSQASITRLIQKFGFKNYNEFRLHVHYDNYALSDTLQKENQNDLECIRQEVYTDILNALNNIFLLDLEKLEIVLSIIKHHSNVLIFGSELSAAISFKLQMQLTSLGKNALCIFDKNYQNQTLKSLSKDTLLICISLEERWFKALDMSTLHASPCKKMLWTIKENHICSDSFDLVYKFGQETSSDLGYNELMYFILLIYRCLSKPEK